MCGGRRFVVTLEREEDQGAELVQERVVGDDRQRLLGLSEGLIEVLAAEGLGADRKLTWAA